MASRLRWKRDSPRQWSVWDEVRDVFAMVYHNPSTGKWDAWAERCCMSVQSKFGQFDTLGKAKRFCEWHTEGNWVNPIVIR